MAEVTIKLKGSIPQRGSYARLYAKAERRVMARCADLAETYAKSYVPVKQGILKRSIYALIRGSSLILGATAPHAAIVEKGSKPHIILPRIAKALRFIVGTGASAWTSMFGRVVFAKRVRHPGTRPQPFLEPAIDAVGDLYGKMVADEFMWLVENELLEDRY